MELIYIIAVSGFMLCLAASFALLSLLNNTFWSQRNPLLSQKLPAAFIYGVMLAAGLAVTAFYPQYYDYINPIRTYAVLLPLVAAGILVIASFFLKRGLWWLVLVGAVAAVCIGANPQLQFTMIAGLSPLGNRLLALGLLVTVSLSLHLLNGIPGLALLQVVFVTLGMFILSLFGGLPGQLGLLSLCFCACGLAFLIYNWYPSKLKLSDQEADILGFLTGCLIIFATAEVAGSSVFVFALVWICEAAIALLKKMTFLKGYADAAANTVTYQANLSGLSPAVICNYAARLNIILLVFGGFQIFAPNFYSLPALCAVIVLLQLYRLANWQEIPDNLREVNRRFVKDVKSGVDNFKKNLRKDG